ncbi:hypothetical protein [Ahniella affigens]|nr:hypothetical protein [Ahniella affigens]
MKRIFFVAAMAIFTCNPAKAEWWVGLQTSGQTTPTNAISIYDSEASGNTSPTRTVGGDVSSLRSIADFTRDDQNDQMVVADFRGNQIVRFDLASQGNAAPLLRFTHAGMQQPRRIIAIPGHHEYGILASTTLLYIGMDAVTGAPITRAGNYTQSGLNNPFGLAYMPATDEVAVGDVETVDGSNAGEIRFFARTDDAALATTRRLFGSNTRLGIFVLGLRHDPVQHELIALVRDNPVNGLFPGRIVVFTESDDGNIAPIREIAGDATQLINVSSLGFDAATGDISVGLGSQTVPLAVLIFNRNDQGNAAPRKRLSGPLTGLNLPDAVGAISYVPASNRLYRDGFE